MTAQAIGSLFVQLGFDTAQFHTNAAAVKGELWSIGKIKVGDGLKAGLGELTDGFKSTAANAGLLGTSLSAMGLVGVAAAGALVGVGAAAAKARQAFDFADEIADTAAQVGASTDYLQEYRFAVQQLGGEYADADAALAGFSKTFGAAQSGLSKKAVKPFQALGLDPKEFATWQDALDAVIVKIGDLEKTSDQAAVADKLGLGSILPALREGADAINGFRNSAKDMGQVMDADIIRKAGEANDHLQILERQIDVDLNTAFAKLAPLIGGVAGFLADGAGAASDMASAFAPLLDKLAELDKWAQGNETLKRLEQFAELAQIISGSPIGIAKGLMKGGQAAERAKAPRADMSAIQAKFGRPSGGGSLEDLGGDKGISAAERASNEAAALEAAEAAELSAREALTQNVIRLAEIRVRQIDVETASQNRRLQEQATEGKISKTVAAKAVLLNEQASALRKELVEREKGVALDREEFAQRQQVQGFLDRVSAAQAELAGTVEARNKIERLALANRQQLELQRVESETAAQVEAGSMLDSKRRETVATLKVAQAAEKELQARQQADRVAQAANRHREAALQNEIDLLATQADLVSFGFQRRDIELKILKARQALERAALEEVVNSKTANADDKKIAQDRLQALEAIHGNEIQAAIGTAEDAFNDVSNTLLDMERAFAARDWNGVLKGVIDAFKLLTASGTNTASKIGAVAGLASAAGGMIGGTGGSILGGAGSGALAGMQLGSIVPGVGNVAGAVIGGLLGGLGGLFGSSKAKKQAKAQAAETERQRLEKIQTDRAQLEIQLLEVMGRKEEALARRRELEVKGMDATNAALLKNIWAEEDARARDAEGLALMREFMRLGDQLNGTNDALLADRKDELDAIHPTNRALQELIHKREDDVAAMQRASQVADRTNDIQIQTMEAAGDAAGALARRRELERAEAIKLDAALGPLLDTLWATQDRAAAAAAAAEAQAKADAAVQEAHDKLQAAYDEEISLIQGVIDRFKAFAASLAAFRRELSVRSLEVVSPDAVYGAARADFMRVSALARAGDEKAMGELQGVSEEFLRVSKDFAPDALTYLRDLAAVKAAVQAAELLALTQVTEGEKQLELLKKQVEGLLKINESVLSVAEAIAQLESAIAAAANDNGSGSGGSSGGGSGLVTEGRFEGFTAAELNDWDESPSEMAWPKYQAWLMLQQLKEAGYNIPGFRTGGNFMVGGAGAPDSQLMQFMASPGEMVSINRAGTYEQLAAEIAGARAILSQILGVSIGTLPAIARDIGFVADIQDEWDANGQPGERAA